MAYTFSKVVVVGTGAIGGYYGGRLARSGVDVRFLARSDFATLREQGLRVILPKEEFTIAPALAYENPKDVGPCDLVLISLKATGNEALLSLLPPLLHERTVLLTLENGLGSDEFLAQHFGGERVIGGLCFICVNRVAPAQVQCFEPGTISIAEYGRPISERLRTIADLFNHAGVRCTVGDNLSELRWKKLVWNVPFNGLSIAAGGVPTDRILASAELEAEARGLMREVIAAAAKFGYTISESFIDKQIDSTRPMGPYKPSSLIDYLAGRDVEVEAIWGEPVRRARAAGASIPKMEMLYALLKQLCAQKRA